ncbi:caspase-1-like [Ischnura elegans]|uniref:caspase-1-like n=1 Tax=Ischnura elegans TaxID=197161 RepID=UPI001ED875EB|nr:caspase-1-like [Ischnura elegans]
MADSNAKEPTLGIQSSIPPSGSSGNTASSVREEDSVPFTYDMGYENRGDFLIFVFKDFGGSEADRNGTEYEVQNLKSVAENWGFPTRSIKVHWDLSEETFKDELNIWAGGNHEKDDCVVIAILTHGLEDVLLTKETRFPIGEIWKCLKGCNSMEGKPKILLIQACRGEQLDEAGNESSTRRLIRSPDVIAGGTKKYVYEYIYPEEPDYIVMYATTLYFKAIRGWLCRYLLEATNVARDKGWDLMNQMTAVARKFSSECCSVKKYPWSHDRIKVTQSPEIFSSLRGKVFLHKGKGEN